MAHHDAAPAAEDTASRSGRRESAERSAVTAVTVATAISLAAFAVTAILVMDGYGVALDSRLLLDFRVAGDPADALGPPWFEQAAIELTTLGGYTVLSLVTFFVAATLCFLRKRAAALFLVSAIVTGSLISTLFKQAFDRPRPHIVGHLDVTFTSSFPSAHAMVSTLTWLTLAAIAIRFVDRMRLRAFILGSAVAISLAVGISRVYLGVHWPSDVVAGWFMGGGWAGICWLCAHFLSRGREPDADLGHSSPQDQQDGDKP